MEAQTIITIDGGTKFYVKEPIDKVLTMIKNTIGDNFITLTLLNYSNFVSGKLYIRAKSIVAVSSLTVCCLPS